MNSQAQAGPSVIRLEGPEPGVLDKSQRSRLLRHPHSRLSFATFDPYTATPRDPSDISKLSLDDEKCRPKRIVIEMVPRRGTFWRWVPSARKQDGVADEGVFPRLVEICGQICECSQEQWDIYKLDPSYDCYIKLPPALTVIVPKGSSPFTSIPTTGSDSRYPIHNGYDSERMEVDDDNSLPPKSKVHLRKRKPSPQEPDFSSVPPPTETQEKRHENEHVAEDYWNRNTKLYKRARTTSPNSGKRAVNAHRNKHETKKRLRMQEELDAKKAMRESRLLQEVLSGIPQGFTHSKASPHMHYTPEEEDILEAENDHNSCDDAIRDKHEEILTESRRKMAELNAARTRERVREKQLGVQEDTRFSARADRHRAEAEKQRVAEELKRREAEAKLAEEARLRQEKQRRRAEILSEVEAERQLRHEQWNSGPWTVTRAIERYKTTCAFFDKANFSDESFPLAFIDIPWPTLKHPSESSAQNVDWQSTNEFFDALQPYLRGQAYRIFLKQTLQRFHPDRWSSRNLFLAIADEDERNEVETAVNAVSKALGALYTDTCK